MLLRSSEPVPLFFALILQSLHKETPSLEQVSTASWRSCDAPVRRTDTFAPPIYFIIQIENSLWRAVLLMGGQEDPTCSPAAVRELHNWVASTDKEIVQ